MKRFFALVLVLMLVLTSGAWAEIDLSSMTMDELIALNNSINNRIQELYQQAVAGAVPAPDILEPVPEDPWQSPDAGADATEPVQSPDVTEPVQSPDATEPVQSPDAGTDATEELPVPGGGDSAALSSFPHDAVLQGNNRRMDFLLLDQAADLNGMPHADIMYQDTSDGHFANECAYAVNAEFSRLTGQAFFSYMQPGMGNCPRLEIRGDGEILFSQEFDPAAENPAQVYTIDVDIARRGMITIALFNSAEHKFYLSEMRFVK